jgi:hypothetical protein
MIEDLDIIVEQRPTLSERWLLPALGTIAVTAVLVSSFAQQVPLRPAIIQSTPVPVSVLRNIGPAHGFKSLELPRTIATAESRTQFSGVTGLTNTGQSDGFRDLYRFADGRVLIVIEYPDPANGALIAPASGPGYVVDLRGVRGQAYPTISTSMPLTVGWVADGMQYQVGGAGFTTVELVRFVEALR